jgi:DNA polymerase III subunit gamma/tau
LGLLKMAHAQKLLPIEELLSEAAAVPRSLAKPSIVPDVRRPDTVARSNSVSPFAADSARKSKLSAEEGPSTKPRLASPAGNLPVVMGAAAPAAAIEDLPEAQPRTEALQNTSEQPNDLRTRILNVLDNAGQRMLSSMLESGVWKVEGNELAIKVSSSPTVIDMSLGADAKRLIVATASGVLGRPVKLKMVSDASATNAPSPRPASNGGGRSRVDQDPIVRRLKEKFGAEIRTVIDYRDKR